jgi:hypothetical protein
MMDTNQAIELELQIEELEAKSAPGGGDYGLPLPGGGRGR